MYDILESLVPGNAKRTAQQILKFIILCSRGEPHAVSAEETGLSVTIMVRLREALDFMMIIDRDNTRTPKNSSPRNIELHTVR